MLRTTGTYLLVAILLCFASTQILSAQDTGTLTGLVTNASGAPVPQANITVKNNATGMSQSVIANQNGNFTVPNLAPGTYTVSVELTGYRRLSQDGVEVVAGQPVKLSLGMQA